MAGVPHWKREGCPYAGTCRLSGFPTTSKMKYWAKNIIGALVVSRPHRLAAVIVDSLSLRPTATLAD
jgi:hypothetical protein